MFVAMNLGINGSDLPMYEDVVFNSRFTSNISRPRFDYCLRNFDILSRCVSMKDDEFTVFEPVFNISKSLGNNFTANSSDMDLSGIMCQDGEQTEERQMLVSGRVGFRLPPFRDGEIMEFWHERIEHTSRLWGAGVSLAQFLLRRIVIGKIGNDSFAHNTNVRAAFSGLHFVTVDLRCMAVLDRENYSKLTFNFFKYTRSNLWQTGLNYTRHLFALAPGVKLNVPNAKNEEFFMRMTLDLIERRPGRHATSFIATFLNYYYKPFESQNQAPLKVRQRSGTKELITLISISSLSNMCVAVLISVDL